MAFRKFPSAFRVQYSVIRLQYIKLVEGVPLFRRPRLSTQTHGFSIAEQPDQRVQSGTPESTEFSIFTAWNHAPPIPWVVASELA